MGRPAALLVPVVALVSLAGCGSGHKATVPPTTTTASSSIPDTTTTTTTIDLSPTSTATPAATNTTTATSAPSPTPSITDFSVSPDAPVCNSPTMVQLQWTAIGASSVDLAIDGKQFATFGGGVQSHLEYYACDGKPHTYLLTARAGSATATASRVVSSSAG